MRFAYKARNKIGRILKGDMEASNQAAVADRLRDLGYTIVSIEPKAAVISFYQLLKGLSAVRTEDLVMLTAQLGNMLAAGMSLPTSLRILADQTEKMIIVDAINQISEDIKGGLTFSEALSKHPRIFSTLFVNMIRAGETAGNLEEVLTRLAIFAEREAELKQKILTALTYPIVLIVVGVIVIFFVITSVLPAFINIFREANIPLPLPTQILFVVNLILRQYWMHMGLAIIVAVVALSYYNTTPQGREVIDRAKLKVPIWGSLIRKVIIARFARTLATLVAAGVPLLQSLETTERTMDNVVISKVIRSVYGSVSKGESMAIPLRTSGEFPPMPIHMIAIGEESGNLELMLNKIADYYELATDYAVRRLTALLEPIFLIVIGGMVGLIFASILLPIFRMVGTLRR